MPDFSVDFSPIGKLADVYRQSQRRAAEEQQFGPLGIQGAVTLAKLAEIARSGKQDERDFAFRQQEAQRAQGNVDRSFALQKQTATEKPQVVWQEGPDGTKVPYQVSPMGGGVKQIPVEGASTQPNNPFMSGGKLNESQSKDALYASRMLSSEKVLRSIDADVATNWFDKARGVVSDKIGYNIRSPEFQKFDQAQRDFINATLRRESGAVISDAEFDNARKQYFPQPGDTKEIIIQKRANRAEAIKGIGAGAGAGYRPESKFDASGEIVPNTRPQPQAKPSGLPRVTSPSEAAKLPKGTRFLDPNGVERIVP